MAIVYNKKPDPYDSSIEYVQIRTPDKLQLSEILSKCKGPDRTMAQFADDCETISASTLSRILNGKITKPLALDILKTIYDHRDVNIDLTYESLCSANGMIAKEVHERNLERRERRYYLLHNEREKNVRNIICNDLFDRGVAIKSGYRYKNALDRIEENEPAFSPYGLCRKSDFMIKLLEFQEDSMWAFNICTYVEKEMKDASDLRFHMERFIDEISPVLLYDAWGTDGQGGVDSAHEIKTSFVFCDEEYYRIFRSLMEPVKFHTSMTTILVNIESQCVVREEWLNSPRMHDHGSLFEQKKETYDNDWPDILTRSGEEEDGE